MLQFEFSPTTPVIPLETVAAETFFGDTRFRPEPLAVASLIQQGLTEEMIIAGAQTKGYAPTSMELTSEQLDVSLPFFHQISDQLAEDHVDDTLLFAGRDAEVLYDDFAITHPEVTGHLLPASSVLWESPGMGISKLATSFLDNYGLTKEATEDTAQKFVLVDSGFYGSIGEAVDMTVKSLYSVSMLEAGRLAVKLVCASDDAIGEQILPVTASEWPRLKWYGTHRIPAWLEANAFGLALGMQLMPRYHGRYCDLELVDGKVVALPRAEPLWLDLDTTVGSMNDSVVNPFAAAIMQYRVVKAALERYAEMHGTERVITPEPEAPRTPIVASPAKSDAVSGVLYLGA